MSTADDGQYDLTDAGFDSFLSRSVDQTPQLNLDSPQPYNNALPFDRTQVTGSQGDTYKMGGVSIAAQDSSITLNDGALNVNDSSTGSNIQAQSGNITYFDSTGNLVVQEGLLPDNATGIRIVDKQQIGLAQFGRFKDGTTALKIAKPNIEVATARNDQLVFNSAQDILKVVQTGTATVPSSGAIAPSSNSELTLVTVVPHNLGFVPIVQIYASLATFLYTGGLFSTLPSYAPLPILEAGSILYTPPNNVQTGTSSFISYYLWYAVDNTNLYIQTFFATSSGTGTVTSGTVPIKYYLLQETAN